MKITRDIEFAQLVVTFVRKGPLDPAFVEDLDNGFWLIVADGKVHTWLSSSLTETLIEEDCALTDFAIIERKWTDGWNLNYQGFGVEVFEVSAIDIVEAAKKYNTREVCFVGAFWAINDPGDGWERDPDVEFEFIGEAIEKEITATVKKGDELEPVKSRFVFEKPTTSFEKKS